jgi:hypothetical protein
MEEQEKPRCLVLFGAKLDAKFRNQCPFMVQELKTPCKFMIFDF